MLIAAILSAKVSRGIGHFFVANRELGKTFAVTFSRSGLLIIHDYPKESASRRYGCGYSLCL
jgi:hypothetical protein